MCIYIYLYIYICILFYVDKLKLDIVTTRVGCGYFYLSWAINSSEEKCKVKTFEVHLDAPRYSYYLSTETTFNNFTDLPGDTPFNVTVFGTNKQTSVVKDSATTVAFDFVRTVAIRGTCIRTHVQADNIRICTHVCLQYRCSVTF